MAADRWTSELPPFVRVRLRRHARTIVPASESSDPQPGPLLLALKAACLRHMIRELPPDPTATLRQLDFRSLHQVYAAWRGRVPQARPRRVHISSDLLDNHDRLAYSDGLVAALGEIAHGHDLRPRTSTAIEHAYTPWTPPLLARGRPGQRHVDRLLADWGLHHLHLGTTPHPKRPEFVSRTRHVLFVAFKPEDAYLVDVAEHESDGANWSALKLLEIVVRNWPEAGILVASTFAVGLTNGNWSDEDRRALRRAGISTGAVEIDRKVWSAGGQTVTGEPIHVARHCMGVSWQLSGYEPTELRVRDELAAMAEKHDVPNEWRAVTHGDEYGFFSSGVFVRYGSLLP